MKRTITCCVCLLCALFVTQAQTKWFVTPGAPAAATGNSWANARDLQSAINNAIAGDSIFVAQGMYQLTGAQSFNMKEGLKMYGCFAGTETYLSERNLKVTYASTLSGNGSPVIINNNTLTAAALLDGFTITNGSSTTGGGIYNSGGSPTISNCIFTNNTGGGIYNYGNAATIINCVFTGNNTNTTNAGSPLNYAGAGGISNYLSIGVTIVNCIFYGNTGFLSGAISVTEYFTTTSVANIFNCTMYGNAATTSNGGALYFINANSSQVKNCIIWGNTAAGSRNAMGKAAPPTYQYADLVNNNLIEGGYPANLDFNPQFTNATNPIGPDNIWGTADDGLRLQTSSFACNNGTSDVTGLPIPNTDMAGGVRIQDGRIDMGAYESAFACNAANTLYVDAGVAVSGNGSSWSAAYKSLYDALLATRQCVNVTSIFVAQGTYQPPANSTFGMLPGVKIYGGFPPGGGAFNQRDPGTYVTILRANGNRVFLNYQKVETTALLDGFTIIGGITTVSSPAGAGILNLNTNPAFNNCIFSDNNIFVYGGSGGGMYNTGSNPLITHCTFINNKAIASGSSGGGGAIYNSSSAPTIRYCNFINNSGNYGGAIFNSSGSYADISNCVFMGNNASGDGGVIENFRSAVVKITNATFVNNTAVGGGGVIDNYLTTLILTNSLFWNNTAAHDADLWDGQNSVQANYNFFQSTRPGAGNINGTANPFVNVTNPVGADGIWYTADDGLRLVLGSSCINTGTPDTTGLLIGNTDIAGINRIAGTSIDIGAYEYDNIPLPITLLSFRGNLQNGLAALQWQSADELNFKQFDIEKSTDGTRFSHVGEVPAKGSGSSYTYNVPQPEPVAYYRLKMVDINGSTTLSHIIRLTQQVSNELFIYPNPATSHINIQVAAAGKMSLYTYDGVLVKTITLQAGINTVAIGDLSTGVYRVTVNAQQATFIKK
jgi:hypothetical protein